jgi:hypothetical protein
VQLADDRGQVRTANRLAPLAYLLRTIGHRFVFLSSKYLW